MVVNTRRLFMQLLRTLRIDAVCDVGSMNGAEALAFRAAVPAARILAFEAHPENYRRMQADPRLHAAGIITVPQAVTDYDGTGEFHMTGANYAPGEHWRGMSSLHRRFHNSELLTTATVVTTRLETALGKRGISGRRLALWIDTEGKAYEVLAGAAGVLQDAQLLHVEVETAECIAREQRFHADVQRLLVAAGFVELATDQRSTNLQFNALFVRRQLSAGARLRVGWRLWLAKLRWLSVWLLRATSPGLARWLLARRRTSGAAAG